MGHRTEDLEETLAFAERQVAPKSVGVDALTQTASRAQAIGPKDKLFEREEIVKRLADFKATQLRFEVEREEFFKTTMASLRKFTL